METFDKSSEQVVYESDNKKISRIEGICTLVVSKDAETGAVNVWATSVPTNQIVKSGNALRRCVLTICHVRPEGLKLIDFPRLLLCIKQAVIEPARFGCPTLLNVLLAYTYRNCTIFKDENGELWFYRFHGRKSLPSNPPGVRLIKRISLAGCAKDASPCELPLTILPPKPSVALTSLENTFSETVSSSKKVSEPVAFNDCPPLLDETSVSAISNCHHPRDANKKYFYEPSNNMTSSFSPKSKHFTASVKSIFTETNLSSERLKSTNFATFPSFGVSYHHSTEYDNSFAQGVPNLLPPSLVESTLDSLKTPDFNEECRRISVKSCPEEDIFVNYKSHSFFPAKHSSPTNTSYPLPHSSFSSSLQEKSEDLNPLFPVISPYSAGVETLPEIESPASPCRSYTHPREYVSEPVSRRPHSRITFPSAVDTLCVSPSNKETNVGSALNCNRFEGRQQFSSLFRRLRKKRRGVLRRNKCHCPVMCVPRSIYNRKIKQAFRLFYTKLLQRKWQFKIISSHLPWEIKNNNSSTFEVFPDTIADVYRPSPCVSSTGASYKRTSGPSFACSCRPETLDSLWIDDKMCFSERTFLEASQNNLFPTSVSHDSHLEEQTILDLQEMLPGANESCLTPCFSLCGRNHTAATIYSSYAPWRCATDSLSPLLTVNDPFAIGLTLLSPSFS